MCGQTFVPFAGPRLWNSFHEASLQLADVSVMFHQVLIRLIKVLFRARRWKRLCRLDGKEGGKGKNIMETLVEGERR